MKQNIILNLAVWGRYYGLGVIAIVLIRAIRIQGFGTHLLVGFRGLLIILAGVTSMLLGEWAKRKVEK